MEPRAADSAAWPCGALQVSRDYLDGSESRVIPRGSYFGEMGLLLPRTPCLATVTVVKDSTLLTISIENWSKVVTQIDHKTAHDLRTEVWAATPTPVLGQPALRTPGALDTSPPLRGSWAHRPADDRPALHLCERRNCAAYGR